MCGRYALGIRTALVRHQLEQHDMPVDDAPEDDQVRETYNFAPGYYGLVYRADVPYNGAGRLRHETEMSRNAGPTDESVTEAEKSETKYKLQAMKWGLVPFWTKRNPDYGSVLKTINARDDSLMENKGMWNTMKKTKRCIVVAQGFYEWLKKNGGKEKVPHYVKRKDGQLMCFAGLWDCVKYEDSDQMHWTYTIITTDSNKQLKFLHDRMPVILENGSEQIRTWLDPKRSEWSIDLQSLLKPFDGELECYPVSKDVGKVGNNSPDFIVPVASSENKSNIANFFANSRKAGKVKEEKDSQEKGMNGKEEDRATVNLIRTEDNAPMPVPSEENLKRARDGIADDEIMQKSPKRLAAASPAKYASLRSPGPKAPTKKASDGSQKISNFFK